MAKATFWAATDAEARKRGEQTGLDTLVVASAKTTVPSSIKAIVPCFSSPAAYASEWMYEISFNFSDPSIATI